MESSAAVETVEAVGASVSALAGFVDRAAFVDRVVGNAEPASGLDQAGSSVPGVDPLRGQADAYLDGLAELARTEARLAALKVQLVAGYVNTEKAMTPPCASPQDRMVRDMAVTAEIAGVLTISERAAGNLQYEAIILTTGRPRTFSALQAGAISWQHARIMVDETENLDPAGAAALEAHFLDSDAPEAVRAMQGPGEARTLTQLRADVTSTWLLTAGLEPAAERTTEGAIDRIPDEFGGVPSPRAQVLVTVPVFSLLGHTEEPAMLDGYGPIPPSMARALVADGATAFHRVLTDPLDGAPLEIGRTSYRLTKAMRQWLRLRDAKCTFPGCNNHSLDNDADHLLAWARGGPTGISNLGQPCPKHHRLKHNSAWTPTTASAKAPPGWTSPAGRHYPNEQPDWEPPHWPPQIQTIFGDVDPAA